MQCCWEIQTAFRDPWFSEIVSEKMKKGKKPESKTEPQDMPTCRSEIRFMVTMTLRTCLCSYLVSRFDTLMPLLKGYVSMLGLWH